MRTQLTLFAITAILASCRADVDVPSSGGGDKTTIVNPPAKEKTVEKTTIVTPPAEKK
jgi:hypothetical protein